ncbi:hypothetical protein RF11_13001 [Thelohanellus kitauei]|uniref:Retrotransposon gag domain-containing protein n=1 Tax=Thelohanellus kitauei TaxID=669202 RepID=A0A0C2JAI6_THEKT|nr:hypothetical protein RF11_13001 [Thelohanellus kitauei]
MALLNTPKSFSDGEIDDWLWKFEACMKAAQKTKNEELAAHLPIFLEGLALKFYRSLPIEVQNSFPKVKEALLSRFSESHAKSNYGLDKIQKSPLESFQEFGYKIKRLVDLSFPSFFPDQRQVIYLQYFTKKLIQS